jgi:hypothetical protein
MYKHNLSLHKWKTQLREVWEIFKRDYLFFSSLYASSYSPELRIVLWVHIVIFIHQREDQKVESRISRTCSSFNMQEEFQTELYSPKCLEETEFDCKYYELVYIILNLALFILKINFFRFVFHCVYSYAWSQKNGIITNF